MVKAKVAVLDVRLRTSGSLTKAMAQLRGLSAEAAKAGLRLRKVSLAHSKLTGGAGASLKGLIKQTAAFSVAAFGIARGFKTVAGAIESALDPLLEFQKNMAAVRGKGEFSAAATASLAEYAKQTGRTSIYKPTEVSAAMIDLAASGLSAEGIKGALPSVLKFAQANAVTAERAGTILVNALSQFGMLKLDGTAADAASVFQSMGNMMTKAANLSTISVEDIATTFKYSSPLASTLKVAPAEALGLTALLGNAGIKGSMAGTAFRNFYAAATAPPRRTANAGKQLAKIGLTQADLKNMAHAPTSMFVEFAKRFFKHNTSAPDRVGIIRTIYGQFGMAAVNKLVDIAGDVVNGKKTIEEVTRMIQDATGAMDLNAKLYEETLPGRIAALAAKWETLKLSFGEKFAPAISRILDKVGEKILGAESWVNKNGPLLGRMGESLERLGESLLKILSSEYMQNVVDLLTRIANELAPERPTTVGVAERLQEDAEGRGLATPGGPYVPIEVQEAKARERAHDALKSREANLTVEDAVKRAFMSAQPIPTRAEILLTLPDGMRGTITAKTGPQPITLRTQ